MGSIQQRKYRGMKTTKALLACLLFCYAVNHISADESKDDVALEKKSDGDNFFAARGRRSGDSSNGAVSPDDFFWANRGKRSVRVLRDQGNFNVPRPNGFFFPSAGKRSSSYNIPMPNGFFFPSATGKRGLSRFFPKRSAFNLPRPNGFIFASKSKKSSPAEVEEVEIRPSKMWNMVKPNGFFFPSVPIQQARSTKRSSDEDDEEVSGFYNILSNMFGAPDAMESDMVKRDNFDESTFFAGRGKKDVDADLAAFFAGRGKKGGNVGDIFF